MYLETTHLLLAPTPLHVVRTRLERDDFHAELPVRPGEVWRVHFPAGWPGDALGLFEHLAGTLAQNPDTPQWGGTLVHRETRTAIGQLGFKGGPDDTGAVELGYGLNPEWHGRGYATEMVGALIAWAFARPDVRHVTAMTRPDNLASIRVLEKNGLVRTGAAFDPEDGELITWARPRPAARPTVSRR